MPSYTATVAFETREDMDWLEVHDIERRLADAMHRAGFDDVAINVEEVDGLEADGDSDGASTAESGTGGADPGECEYDSGDPGDECDCEEPTAEVDPAVRGQRRR